MVLLDTAIKSSLYVVNSNHVSICSDLAAILNATYVAACSRHLCAPN